MASRSQRFTLQEWNGDQLQIRTLTVMTAFRPIMFKQLKTEIQAPQFNWTGKLTTRSNGETVGSPRNIVDTGAFLASQRAKTNAKAGSVEIAFTWGSEAVNYAGIILQGKGESYPARDWIAKALEKQPFEQFFVREWRKLERQRV